MQSMHREVVVEDVQSSCRERESRVSVQSNR